MDDSRLRRVFDILSYLTLSGPATVTQISSGLNVPLSSTHDLVKGLVKIGALESTAHGYVVGPTILRLSFQMRDRFDIAAIASSEMERLVERIGFDTYLATRTGTKVLYTARFPGRRSINIDIPLGRPLYLHATAVGKLFAAYDQDIYRAVLNSPRKPLTSRTKTSHEQLKRNFASIRSRGVSITRGEAVPAIIGVAAPIRGPDGSMIAAAHVSALQSEVSADRLKELCVELKKTATAIECAAAHSMHFES